jgi:hypothetical protein
MRLFGDGKHGQSERIQTLRGRGCHTTFSARRNTPLSRLKTPSHQIALVRISRWLKGWTFRLPNGSQGYRQATITSLSLPRGLARAHPARAFLLPSAAPARGRWTNGAPGCAAPSRCVLLWLAIDPLTKILPVLELGPRTQHLAHRLIHALRESLAAFLPPALSQ